MDEVQAEGARGLSEPASVAILTNVDGIMPKVPVTLTWQTRKVSDERVAPRNAREHLAPALHHPHGVFELGG